MIFDGRDCPAADWGKFRQKVKAARAGNQSLVRNDIGRDVVDPFLCWLCCPVCIVKLRSVGLLARVCLAVWPVKLK